MPLISFGDDLDQEENDQRSSSFKVPFTNIGRPTSKILDFEFRVKLYDIFVQCTCLCLEVSMSVSRDF